MDVRGQFSQNEIDMGNLGNLATAFSPDGKLLAVACEGNNICLLNSADGKEISRFKAHTGIIPLAFSPDGSLLARSSDRGSISIWAIPPVEEGSAP